MRKRRGHHLRLRKAAQGLYPEQITVWRTAYVQANAPVNGQAERAQRRVDQQRVKQLEQEV